MNKNAIKNFSIWARRKLIEDVAYRAWLLGITPAGIAKALPQSTLTTEFYDIGTKDPYVLTGDGISQRRRLVDTIYRSLSCRAIVVLHAATESELATSDIVNV